MTPVPLLNREKSALLYACIALFCGGGILFLPQKSLGKEKAKLLLTFGTSTTTNVFSNALEIGDKFTDVNLSLAVPHALTKKTSTLFEYLYKQDWKKDHDEINATLQNLGVRLSHRIAEKHSAQVAYLYQNYDIYHASGINLSLQTRHSKTSTLKLDYTFQKRAFSNNVQNGTNHTTKLSYTLPVDSISTLTPFYQYEINTTNGAPNFEYKGNTAGLHYAWTDWRKPKKKISYTVLYDYRIRNYDTPFLLKGMLSTKQERRHQLNLGILYHASKNTKFIFNYIYFENHASSENAFYVKGKTYRAHIFSAAIQLEPFLTSKKKSKSPEMKDE